MSNLIERHEKERQMEVDIRIQQLRIKRLEHQMAYELDPFDPEFDEAAEKLRKLKAALYSAGVKKKQLSLRDRPIRERGSTEEAGRKRKPAGDLTG